MNLPPQQLSNDSIQTQALALIEELESEEKMAVLDYLQSLLGNTDDK